MKPGIPSGMRDYAPSEMRKRQFIIKTLTSCFEKFGFDPLETPAMENLNTLTGKYGEEGDKLLYKILNQGDFTKDIPQEVWESKEARKVSNAISGKGLRYDLTVPMARFVVMNRNDLALPFRRYQIQPVWRGDRPQKGRYREFWQCDADIIGTPSLYNEAELLHLYRYAFNALYLPEAVIRINNRKLLNALAKQMNAVEKITEITILIDKLDKIGMSKLLEEMLAKGYNDDQIQELKNYLSIEGNNAQKCEQLRQMFDGIPEGIEAIHEISEILRLAEITQTNPVLDTTLARGLDYYTGMIVEVGFPEVFGGSVGGGGRCDDLTGVFGWKDNPGVGISFGLDRIYLIMEELNRFPQTATTGTKVLFIHAGEAAQFLAYQQLQKLREQNITSQMYPASVKLEKQMKYADQKQIPFVIIIREEELVTGNFILKNMMNGNQEKLSWEEVIQKLNEYYL